MKNLKKVILAVLAAGLIAGCKNGLPAITEASEIVNYSGQELKLIVNSERNRYQKIYTDKIWDVDIDGNGTTFQNYLLKQIEHFTDTMRVTAGIAKSNGLTISAEEQEKIKNLSQKYYEGMSGEEKKYTGASLSDIQQMYEEYCLANKAVKELISEKSLEVSDSEAKIITIEQIVTDDEESAKQAKDRLEQQEDFDTVAKELSKTNEIKRQIGHGTLPKELETVAFELANDEISDIVSSDNQYYILKCINDYDEAATKENKSRMLNDRKQLAFRQIYDNYVKDHNIDQDEEVWKKITIDSNSETGDSDFFALYKEYMEE